MANSKITDLTELTSAANDDVLVIVDDSASETKKITVANLSSGISNPNELDGQVLEVITRDTAYTNGSYEGHVMKYRTDTLVELKWYILGSLGWTATDADEEPKTKGLLGLALGTSSGTNGLLIRGVHQSTLWSSFTVGQTLYLSTTEGTITATAPTAAGDFVRVIGYAMGSNNIYIDPAQDYIELS
mgnify:CR=1 FL=1|tara:strand:- start:1498 stop:2058 length:561 start_codon:yes stop_codon:yes gene_type:complete